MSRGTAADNSFTPAEINRLFRTAARIDEANLQENNANASVELAFLVYFLGRLGFRLGFLLHFGERHVWRDEDGTIVAIEVPNYDACERGEDGDVCNHCKNLAAAVARNADEDDVSPEDFYDQYWSPKSQAGGRAIPVIQERGREIIDRFLEEEGEFDGTGETVRRRLTRLAEATDEIDPGRMMPQSLRASAANYWMMLQGFGSNGLKMLMGWKYLSTAEFYISTSFNKLWYLMSRGLGLDPDAPYEIDPQPPTYAEIRGDAEPIYIGNVTPDSEVSRHKYGNHPNPLEKEALESQGFQSRVDQFGDDTPMQALTASGQVVVGGMQALAFAAARGAYELTALDRDPEFADMNTTHALRMVPLLLLGATISAAAWTVSPFPVWIHVLSMGLPAAALIYQVDAEDPDKSRPPKTPLGKITR